jgi:hypothetical protein
MSAYCPISIDKIIFIDTRKVVYQQVFLYNDIKTQWNIKAISILRYIDSLNFRLKNLIVPYSIKEIKSWETRAAVAKKVKRKRGKSQSIP